MPILWLGMSAICFFMFIFAAANISGNQASFLAIGWFIGFCFTLFEASTDYRASRRQPTRADRNREYWEKRRKVR